jgi:uncharacterized protein (TIGR02145 family)
MKKNYTIGLIILSLLISQQLFPQKENTKNSFRGEQQIELSEGYSFVSSPIMSENPDMQEVLQNNLANLEFVRNSQGLMLRKIGPNWVNSIGNWVNTEGYLFKMSSGDNLIITGDVIDPQTPLELSTGYQIIGYLPDEALNIEDVFQDILENLDFVRNTAGLMLRKIGPVWVNSIGDMQPGEGYLVKMNSEDILIYPGSSSFTCGDPFTDPRNGQTYNTVQIAGQCWMAENLNIGTMVNGNINQTDNGIIEKYCYDNNTVNCVEYGGLYQWNEMMEYATTPGVQGICPAGWHLPTDDEWKILEGTVDSQYPVGDPEWDDTGWRGSDAGINLKSTSGWNNNGNGSDLYGFSSLPSGARSSPYGNFIWLTITAHYWTSNDDLNSAIRRVLKDVRNDVNSHFDGKTVGLSVRCLKDETTPTNQPPEPPSNPNPEDGAVNQSIEIDLSWTCTDPESDPLTYDIYFGTEATPSQVTTGQTETFYYPETLENNTEYFWKIIAHDDQGNTTVGPVWSFTTMAEPDCDDGISCTVDYYDYELEICVHEPNDDICNDGVFCNGQEICDPTIGCISGTPPVLDDGIDCTIDICDEALNVVLHIPDDNACDDGDPETTDICDPELGCLHISVFSCGNPFTDSRDGQTYETVQIGNQCWMAENLNIGTMVNGNQSMSNDGVIEKYCQYNNADNCDIYGGLYQWNEMMEYSSTQNSQGICPSDWHVPSDDEWKILEGTVDSQYPVGDPIWNTTNFRGFDVGKNLRSTTGWYQNSGTDLYGFNALPGGAHYSGYFNYLSYQAYFWTSSEYYSGDGWDRSLKYFVSGASRDAWPGTFGYSVRCVKD